MGDMKKLSVRQSDIRRMMRAVQAEGFNPRTVCVTPKGDVSIDVSDFTETHVDPLDQWRDRRGSSFARH